MLGLFPKSVYLVVVWVIPGWAVETREVNLGRGGWDTFIPKGPPCLGLDSEESGRWQKPRWVAGVGWAVLGPRYTGTTGVQAGGLGS